MKIVLFIDWFLYYTVELANALSESHEVMLVTRDHNFEISSPAAPVSLKDFLDRCLHVRVQHEILRFRRSDMRNIKEILRVFKLIIKFKPDALHVQENSDWRIFLISWWFGFRRTVLTVHDVHRHPGESGRISEWMTRGFRRKAAQLVVHGESLKKELVNESVAFADKTTVIPHGAFGIYRHWDDSEIAEEKHTILLFGRMTPYKGLGIILEAEPLISREIPDINVILAGRGPELVRLRSAMVDNPHFEIHDGFIANEDIPRFFRRAAIVILPYTEASQSGVVPLAYVFGKPVIVTSVGSIPEVVRHGETGLIVSPRAPRELAEAVLGLLNDPSRRESMGKNARFMADTELSWGTIAAKTTQLYSRVINR